MLHACISVSQAVRAKGIKGHELPPYSALTVPVPGAAALWEDVVKEFGSKSLGEVQSYASASLTHPTDGLS